MVPEKLYLSENIYNTFVYQIPDNDDKTQVEYIRKDAFIEKAIYYIANNMQCNGYTLQTKGKFIRDFKKYMEE